VLFWLINMYVVWLGVDSIRKLLVFKAFFLPLAALALLYWAISHVHGGLGPILAIPSAICHRQHSGPSLFPG
jgi:NCS1 family nucleobase:cation symporter-1